MEKSSSRHLIYDAENEAFYDTDGMEWVPKPATASRDADSLIEKLETLRPTALLGEWMLDKCIAIIRQHEAKTLQYKGQNFTIGEGKPPKEIPYENEDTATGEMLSSEISVVDEAKIAELMLASYEAKENLHNSPDEDIRKMIEAIGPYLRTTEPQCTVCYGALDGNEDGGCIMGRCWTHERATWEPVSVSLEKCTNAVLSATRDTRGFPSVNIPVMEAWAPVIAKAILDAAGVKYVY